MPQHSAKTALVTGAAKRLGRAIAEDLAAHGFAVAIHANTSLAEAEALAAAIRAKGGRAVAKHRFGSATAGPRERQPRPRRSPADGNRARRDPARIPPGSGRRLAKGGRAFG